jgi:hypothetical protein
MPYGPQRSLFRTMDGLMEVKDLTKGSKLKAPLNHTRRRQQGARRSPMADETLHLKRPHALNAPI